MTNRRQATTALGIALLVGFGTAVAPAPEGAQAQEPRRMWMTIGERRFAIALADNDAARAFASLLPLTLDMPDLNGNEKHVKLPRPLPVDASRPGTIRNGDLMLWGADTLVVFYVTFDSSYAYTRLGRIEDAASLPQVLGRGEVRIRFSRD